MTTKFQPGNSLAKGHGRPKGSSLQKRLKDAVGERFDELVNVILDAALSGDMNAASILLGRMVPVYRSQQEPVSFNLNGITLTDKAVSVFDAVAAGELSPSDGKTLLDGLAGVVRVKDLELLTKQIEQIQAILKADKKVRAAA